MQKYAKGIAGDSNARSRLNGSPWRADADGDKHCEEAVLVGRRRSRENGRDEQRQKTHRWLGVA